MNEEEACIHSKYMVSLQLLTYKYHQFLNPNEVVFLLIQYATFLGHANNFRGTQEEKEKDLQEIFVAGIKAGKDWTKNFKESYGND